MSSRLAALAERRKALTVRSDQDRAALAAIVGGLEREFGVAKAVASVRRLHRHRFLVGVLGVCAVLAPVVARGWMRRAIWIAPLVFKRYRTVKARRTATP